MTRQLLPQSCLLLAAMMPIAALQAAEPTDARQAAACAVWARERSFADTVARNDLDAFAEHVHPQGVFSVAQPGAGRLVGRDAIVQGWGPIVGGHHMTIRWYPTSTVASPDGNVVWSSGPALVIARSGTAGGVAPTYHIGAFHSVWARDADGVWRVIFDDGVEPVPANPEQVADFDSGQSPACPSGA